MKITIKSNFSDKKLLLEGYPSPRRDISRTWGSVGTSMSVRTFGEANEMFRLDYRPKFFQQTSVRHTRVRPFKAFNLPTLSGEAFQKHVLDLSVDSTLEVHGGYCEIFKVNRRQSSSYRRPKAIFQVSLKIELGDLAYKDARFLYDTLIVSEIAEVYTNHNLFRNLLLRGLYSLRRNRVEEAPVYIGKYTPRPKAYLCDKKVNLYKFAACFGEPEKKYLDKQLLKIFREQVDAKLQKP